MLMQGNEKQNADRLTTDEILEKIKEDKKQLKKSSAFAFAAMIAIIALAIAWFAGNHAVTAETGTVSASTLPYCLATKKTAKDDNLLNGLKDILQDQLNIGKGTELKIGNDTYYISNGGDIRLQVSADNNMNNNADNAMEGIAPGDSGEITFYVIPREKGYKEFSFQMHIAAYKDTETGIQEMDQEGIANFLNGHILFFRNYSEDAGYTSWIKDGKFTVKSENGEEFVPDEPIPVNIYWIWPEYFQSFMNSKELFKNQDVIREFVTDMNLDTKSSDSSNKKYFLDFNKAEFGSEDEWTFETLNAKQFTYLTECYDAADFQIGTNIDYFYFDFECQ